MKLKGSDLEWEQMLGNWLKAGGIGMAGTAGTKKNKQCIPLRHLLEKVIILALWRFYHRTFTREKVEMVLKLTCCAVFVL